MAVLLAWHSKTDHLNQLNFHEFNPQKPVMVDSRPLSTEANLTKSVLCGLAVCIGSFLMGATVVYPSPAIPNLDDNRNPFHVDPEQTSWIGSVVSLGALVGGFIGGPLMDKMGRKLALISCAGPFSMAWIVVVASPNFSCLLVGRTLTGICAGVYSVICPIYLGEIAPASIRGLLGSCHQLSVCIGTLYVYVLGSFMSWTWLSVSISAVNLIFVCVLVFVPETPRWLLSVGRKDAAEWTLRWLLGNTHYHQQKLDELENVLQRSKENITPAEFLQPHIWKPLLICLGLMVFHQFCGSKVISIYTVQIFQMSKDSLDANMQTIVVGAMGIVGNLVPAIFADYTGRRVLLIGSGLVMALTMAGIGVFFYLRILDEHLVRCSLSWLPMTCLMIFNFGYNVGLGPISWLIMSELFPLRIKGIASGICVAFNWLLSFIVTKFFVDITSAIHPYGGFWMCAAFCILLLPFVVVFVPETMGKSLEELQKRFQ